MADVECVLPDTFGNPVRKGMSFALFKSIIFLAGGDKAYDQ